ncbi:hypothetical protein DRQ36_10235 [bacterium]|nr:MAG: hypothetical protein DRQ36_10235 [bacterium]
MAYNSSIEWTETTWNPVTGCTKISDGCLNCYAERMARRLRAMGQKKYANGFDVTVHPDVLDEPNHWLKSRLVFVCSMSDLFHDKVSLTFIQRVFDVMENNPDHTFQVLTKRSERLVKIADKLPWPNNIWLGVTVENSKYISRIDDLKKTPAKVKFVSAEPLLSEIPTLDLRDIHWVIVGGESGPGARPIETEWVTDIRDQCAKANVAFFFKQWGGLNKKKAGRELDGKLYSELPLDTLNV